MSQEEAKLPRVGVTLSDEQLQSKSFEIPFDFVREMEHRTYTDFRNVQLFVPEGLLVPYTEHGTILSSSLAYLQEVDTQFIDVFSKWLAQCVGSPTTLQAAIPTINVKAAKLDKMDLNESAYQEQFATSGIRLGSRDYLSVIKRQGDWAVIFKNLNDLTAQCNDKMHVSFVNKLKRVDELLDTIEKRSNQSPETYTISPTVNTGLVECSHAAAKIFEFYGLTRYRIDAYRKAVVDSVDKLTEVLHHD